ncbi:hypothetical protein G4B88_009587 [Cannabis sativa]|uniref:60S acidic ribosomal protein P3 n=1 Tax=Cannabis sativa TaxID=3483 RepID=A0A7J6GGQ5_CANSA|nr:hypothetical protein G4B88_009587 [Cannabis sativa]
MGVFTFVCKSSGGEWTAKQHSGDLEASASSPFELQRKLVQTALSADSSGGVQSSFSYVSPSSAVFQVIIGGGGGGAVFSGGAAAAAPMVEPLLRLHQLRRRRKRRKRVMMIWDSHFSISKLLF